MAVNNKLERLYDLVLLNGSIITLEMLTDSGFILDDVNGLVIDGTLAYDSSGSFLTFKDADGLFNYGTRLLSEKRYRDLVTRLNICHEIDPNNQRVRIQLLFYYLRNDEYDKTFEIIDEMLNSNNKSFIADANYYLYLMSFYAALPGKYKRVINGLEYADVLVLSSDNMYYTRYMQNMVRRKAFNGKLKNALSVLNDYIKQFGYTMDESKIEEFLLIKGASQESKNSDLIVNFVKSKNYTELYRYLSEKSLDYGLTRLERDTIWLLEHYLNIKNTGMVPEIISGDAENIFEAVDKHNYKLALELEEKFTSEVGANTTSFVMSTILTDIYYLIQELNLEENKFSDMSITLGTISSYLMDGDFDNGLKALRHYLKSINRAEYEFLISDLIKVSLFEGDAAFTKPMLVLSLIKRDNFTVNISEYIQEYYSAIGNGNFEVARVYLDIITKADKTKPTGVLIEALEQVLTASEKVLPKVRKKKMILPKALESAGIDYNQNATAVTSANTESTSDIKSLDDSRENSTKKIEVSSEDIKEATKFISDRAQELYQKKGIMILKPMSLQERSAVSRVIDNYYDIAAFTIGSGENIQIVLRYFDHDSTSLNSNVELKKVESFYKSRNYGACIAVLVPLLSKMTAPPAYVYARLGLCYYKTRNIDRAIDYLTVATELAKKSPRLDVSWDFTEMIGKLKALQASKEYHGTANPNSDKKAEPIPMTKDIELENTDLSEITFDTVSSYLFNGNIDKALSALASYMNFIDKLEYEFLVANLIKLSVLEGDTSFIRPMAILSLIKQEQFVFDIKPYIKDFYSCILENNLDEARIYFNIIVGANKLSEDYISRDEILQILDRVSETMREKDKVKNFVSDKYGELLEHKGLVLLQKMNPEFEKKVCTIFEKLPDVVLLPIKTNNQRRIALRYKPLDFKYINYGYLFKIAKSAYDSGDYHRCIDTLLPIFQDTQEYPSVYSLIGLSYSRLGDNMLGSNYLEVAAALSGDYVTPTYCNVMKSLEDEMISEADYKPYFSMSLEDFEQKDAYREIDNLSQITELALEKGLDIETTCRQLGLTSSEIDKIKLTYAKIFIAQGDNEKAFQFVRSVEKRQHKTRKTKDMLDSFRRYTRIESFRSSNGKNALSLKLKPGNPSTGVNK